jgi:hypothetical protein
MKCFYPQDRSSIRVNIKGEELVAVVAKNKQHLTRDTGGVW